MIDLAVQLAEKQLIEGTASAQVISHYLKMGSTRQKDMLERKLLDAQVRLTEAKAEIMLNPSAEAQKYEEALQAMKRYGGHLDDEDVQ